MPHTTQNVAMTLESLFWVPDPLRDQDLQFQLGVWPVFFKIDGSTAQVSDAPDTLGKLIGTATVSGTTGVGKLEGNLAVNGSLAVPPEIGQWLDQVEPIPLGPNLHLGPNVAGIFGVAVIVFDSGGLEADALVAGHAALNDAVLTALNDLIAGLPPFPQDVPQSVIDALVQAVHDKVDAAVRGSLDTWDKLHEWLFDNTWFGSAFAHFTQDDLPAFDPNQADFSLNAGASWVGWVGVNAAMSQSRRSVGQGVLSHFHSPVQAVAGYADPTFQHAIVATQDGRVTEIWWQGPGGVGQGTLSTFASSIVSLAGFYSPDGYQHVIVATQDGVVTELWWQGPGGVGRGPLSHFSDRIVALAGYSSADGYNNVIVATQDGNVWELWWQGTGGVGQGVLAHFDSPIVDMAGYYAADGFHHVIVATKDGNITELWWQGSAAAAQNALAQVEAQGWNGVIGVGGYYAPSDNEQHVIVAMSNGELREFFWTPGDGRGLLHDDLSNIAAIRPIIDAYFDASGYQHAIVATTRNDVQEVWWHSSVRISWVTRPPIVRPLARIA